MSVSSFAAHFHRLLLTITGLAVVLWAGCQSESQPITSKTSKYEVAQQPGAAAAESSKATESGDASSDANSPLATADQVPFSPPATEAPGSQTVTTNDEAPPAASPTKPSSTPPKSAVASTPESNDPKELLKYMSQLSRREPRASTRAEAFAALQQTQYEVIAVADKILALKPDAQTELGAVEGKFQAYTILMQMGQTDANGEMQAFLATIAQSKNEEVAQLARRMTFAQQMDAFQAGTFTDSDKLMRDFRALFENATKDASLFVLGNQVANIFMQHGKNAETLEAMKLIRDSFQDSPDPNIKTQVDSLNEQIAIVELDINLKLGNYLKRVEGADKELFDALDKLFARKDLGATSLDIARQIAELVESRDFQAAGKVHEHIGAAFTNHSNAEISKMAVEIVSSYDKRKALMGKPFVVEGVNLDGSPFDWSKYKGKIVLVDFWATWCQPCLREMPNIRQNYEKYRDQGFEVVGVNIDENPEDVERFFGFNKIAWSTVRPSDPTKTGFDHPLLVASGAQGIPFIVLVGRDGNVIALNLRGDQLGEKLAQLLGEPTGGEAKPAETKTDEKTGDVRRFNPSPKGSFVAVKESAGEEQLAAAQVSANTTRPLEISSGSSVDGRHQEGACDEPAEGAVEEESNPYLAATDLTPAQLVDFILNMQEKPQTIQQRPGFAQAVADAALRALSGELSEPQKTIAVVARFQALHQAALSGDEKADELRRQFAEERKQDKNEQVVREIELVQAELSAINAAKLPADKIGESLDKLSVYIQKEKLSDRHHRLASAIVEAINQLPDVDQREKRFSEFGKVFAKSDDRLLAKYGAKLSEEPEEPEEELSQWIGKALEITGNTVLGNSFDWKSYRGKVVLVDVWATWCGPCRAQMPKVKALYERLNEKGFEVVGINVDKDASALESFLAENEFPWATVAGQEAFDLARTLGIRGIPTMLLVDTEGKVAGIAHDVAKLEGMAESLLPKSK